MRPLLLGCLALVAVSSAASAADLDDRRGYYGPPPVQDDGYRYGGGYGQGPGYGQDPAYGQGPAYGQTPGYGRGPAYGAGPAYGRRPVGAPVPADQLDEDDDEGPEMQPRNWAEPVRPGGDCWTRRTPWGPERLCSR